MTDEIMIERLEAAHDRALAKLHLGCTMYDDDYEEDEANRASHWDEWMIDNAIDCAREEM